MKKQVNYQSNLGETFEFNVNNECSKKQSNYENYLELNIPNQVLSFTNLTEVDEFIELLIEMKNEVFRTEIAKDKLKMTQYKLTHAYFNK